MRVIPFAAAAVLASSLAPVAASQCTQTGELSGRVETVNHSQELQYGVTSFTIDVDGDTFFSDVGVVIGQTVGTQPNGLPILNHTVYFRDGTRFHTFGDKVVELTPVKFEKGQPCAFDAVETFTSASATRKLRRLSNANHEAVATGRVSYCTGDPRNSFVLSGKVCIN